MVNKLFVSIPYIYPVCPLSIDHSRMFVIADIVARHARKNGAEVAFPVASHYSGNTAQNISLSFSRIFSGESATEQEKKFLTLFEKIYSTPGYVLKNFVNPLVLLDYYSQEILQELKILNVSCDYEYFYTTKREDFAAFVGQVMSEYKSRGLLIKNGKGGLSLNYDDLQWKSEVIALFDRTNFIQPSQKSTVLAAMKNVRSDWGFLRKGGYGVRYGNDWVIDPMFDSELFTIFDLYVFSIRGGQLNMREAGKFFENLFDVLREGKTTNDPMIKKIEEFLPCDLFICEEHLKNWVVKRMYAETCFLPEKYRTKGYFVTGMGLLNGKRMSASRGNAILTKDLIKKYGPILARLIMLFTGGHPSKFYHYDYSLPEQVEKMLNSFKNHLLLLHSVEDKQGETNEKKFLALLEETRKKIESLLERGFFRQAIVELLVLAPKKFMRVSKDQAGKILDLYARYTDILLPGLMENYNLINKIC